MLKTIISTIVLGTVTLGCQATSTTAKAPAKLDSAHAACSKCEVKSEKLALQEKGRTVGYTDRKTMQCDDCKDAVANLLTRGKFEHTCTTCGPQVAEACQAH